MSSTTIEGPANFTFDGIKSSVPAYLDAVNTSYTELKTLSPDGVVTLGGDRVIVDRTAPIFDSLAIYSLEVANKTCQKRCTVRVAIDAAEELSSCTATIGGIAANITGTGSERVAEAYIDENSGVAAGAIAFSVTCLDLACNSVTTSTLVGDTDAVIYSLDRDIPLEVLFYSDRPGHLEVGNENDCLMMEMRFRSRRRTESHRHGQYYEQRIESVEHHHNRWRLGSPGHDPHLLSHHSLHHGCVGYGGLASRSLEFYVRRWIARRCVEHDFYV